MKSLVSKTWQRIVALFLTVVAVFGVFGFTPVSRKVSAAAGETQVAEFTFGENGTATHTDGTDISTGKSYSSGDYTLTLESATKVYEKARDAQGNSALKLGTGSAAASFKFTVTGEVVKVIIDIAGYKNNNAKISVNDGATQTISTLSNNGEYTKVEVDTATNKTVTFKTISGGYRAMIHSIRFFVSDGGEVPPACTHENKVAIGKAQAATCTVDGITAGEKCSDCGEVITAQEAIPATGHSYVNGVCSVCNAEEPTMITIDRDSFGTASGYDWHSWTATTTTGETVSGSGYIYATTNDSMQMNAKTATNGNYIYNATALPGKITVIKVSAFKTTYREFVVLTSETPFDSTSANRLTSTETAKTVNDSGAVWEITNNHKYFAVVLAETGGAAYLSSIEIEYYVCPHTNTTVIGENKDATCTEEGSKAGEKCVDCGEIITEIEIIPAAGHTDVNPADSKCDTCGANLCTEHSWADGDVITEPTCTETGLQTQVCENCGELGEDKVLDALGHTTVIDEAVAPTCTESGLTEGSHCSVCEEVFVAQEEVDALEHNYVDGACANCGDEQVFFQKVTDVSELAVLDRIIIVANGADVALGAQSGNNCPQAAIVKDGDTVLFSGTDGVQILTLASGMKEGTFAFYTGAEYLYAASSGSNHLKTEADLSYNSSWEITIAEDGVATIKAQGENTRNWLRYNSNSKLFSCYGSGQADVVIYKAPRETAPETPVTADIQTSVVLTSDLALNFYVENVDGATITINDTPWVASGSKELNGKQYGKYTYKNIEPQQIADKVIVKVTKDGEEIGSLEYSVKAYCDQIIEEDADDKLVNLCKALLHYGAEAQKVAGGYDLGNLANKGLTALDKVVDSSVNDYVVDDSLANATVEVDGIGLVLNDSITVKYVLKATDWSDSMRVKIFLDGVEVTEGISAISGENGTYTFTYTFATAADFSKKIVVIVGDDDGQKSNLVQYSVKTYCAAMAEDAKYGALVNAIYNYVDAIDAYNVGA